MDWDAENGLLVLEMGYYGTTRRLFLSSWDRGIGWATDWSGELELMPWSMNPGLPLLNAASDWASFWRERIPLGLRDTLSNFSSERWAMLCWSSRSKAALDLLRGAPALLWVLLMTARMENWGEERIEACLGLKRRDILAACGLHPANATLKLLSKFQGRPFGRYAFELIRPWLKDPEFTHSLRHYRTVTEVQLCFLGQFPELADSPLVRNVPTDVDHYFRDLEQWYIDIWRMREALGTGEFSRRFRHHPNLQALQGDHDRLVRRLNALEIPPTENAQESYRSYPAPPIPGTETIVPITCYHELALEAKTQSHCIRSYHRRIQAGDYYAYKVLKPQRATLGILLMRGMPPRLEQIRRYGNLSVSKETLHSVRTWFEEALKANYGMANAMTSEGENARGETDAPHHLS